jgi:hypothetical protein
MKHFKHILLICFLAGLFSSCEEWLSEAPFDKVPGDELYATEQGAQEALNGLYLGLLDRSIYGGELTVGVVEALAQHYYVPAKHRYESLALYDYADDRSKTYVSAIWSKLYALISETNVFIEQVELNKDRYSVAHYKLLRGEALALRAYLHFDLFRLFAPPYTSANQEARAIPYYDKEAKAPVDYLTVGQVPARLLADIDEAITLLAADPILDGTEISKGEGFWDYRNFRLNIYAAWVLKARVYLHAGNKPDAYTIASSLLNGTMPGGGAANFMTVFPSVKDIYASYREPLCYTEIIFGMHDVDRLNLQKEYFSTDLFIEKILLAGTKRTRTLFNYTGDTRGASFMDALNYSSADSLKMIVKYQQGQLYDSGSDPYPYRYETISLIKKSEVYLIAAEASDNDVDKARWLTLLRLDRGYLQDNMNAFLSELDQVLQDEYDRELYAEGQYLYFLKRNEKTSVPGQTGANVALSEGKLTLPVPEAEDYNRQ